MSQRLTTSLGNNATVKIRRSRIETAIHIALKGDPLTTESQISRIYKSITGQDFHPPVDHKTPRFGITLIQSCKHLPAIITYQTKSVKRPVTEKHPAYNILHWHWSPLTTITRVSPVISNTNICSLRHISLNSFSQVLPLWCHTHQVSKPRLTSHR